MLWGALSTPTLPYCCWNCCCCYCIVVRSLMHNHATILLPKLLLLQLLYCCGKLDAHPRYHTVAETAAAAAIVLLWGTWCTPTIPYCCWNCCCCCYCIVVNSLMHTIATILLFGVLVVVVFFASPLWAKDTSCDVWKDPMAATAAWIALLHSSAWKNKCESWFPEPDALYWWVVNGAGVKV